MKNFWVRAVSAVVYVALFLFCIYSGALTGSKLWGGVILTAFLLFVACGSTFEFFRIVKQQGATPSQPLGYAYAVAALLALSAVAYGKVWGYVGLGWLSAWPPWCSCGSTASSRSAMPHTPWCPCSMPQYLWDLCPRCMRTTTRL